METAYHLHYILSRRYGPDKIKVHFIDLLDPSPEGEVGKLVDHVKENSYDEPVIALESQVISHGYIHPWTLFELIEERGFQPVNG